MDILDAVNELLHGEGVTRPSAVSKGGIATNRTGFASKSVVQAKMKRISANVSISALGMKKRVFTKGAALIHAGYSALAPVIADHCIRISGKVQQPTCPAWVCSRFIPPWAGGKPY